MNVDSILVSDYASTDGGGKLYINGVFNRITASGFPALHPLISVSLVIHAHPDERGVDHQAEIKLLNSTRETVVPPLEFTFQFGEDAPPPGLPLRHVVAQRLIGVQFAEPGVYAFEVYIDGVYHATASLWVEQVAG